jgi:large subunit ribosomal protein L21
LLEVVGDWACTPGQEIIFEKVLSAGSEDFTLLGRPTIPTGLVKVKATCVEKRINDSPFVRFRNPRAPRKPALSFRREKCVVFRINEINISPTLK